MGYWFEGEVAIPLEEFWQFASQYHPNGSANIRWGIPRVVNEDLVLSIAANTECDPFDQVEKPLACTEWQENSAETEVDELRAALKEAMSWNWLDDERPPTDVVQRLEKLADV